MFERGAVEGRVLRVAALACRWREWPELQTLRTRLDALPDEAGRDGLIEAAAPLLDDIDWIGRAIADFVAEMRGDPWFEPPLRAVNPGLQAGLVLFDAAGLRITVQSIGVTAMARHKLDMAGGRSIAFPGVSSLIRVVRGAGTVLDLWEADAADGGFTARQAGQARRTGTRTLENGDLLRFDGAREAWTIARQSTDIVLVQAVARDARTPLAIEYDAGSGAFVAASATDGTIARMQLMATLLRLMKRRDAAPLLTELAEEGPFFLRWHMTRELVVLAPDIAAPLLRRMAEADPHDDVRRAARQTLDLLSI